MGHEAQAANEQSGYIEHRNPAAPVDMCQRTPGALALNPGVHTYCVIFLSPLLPALLHF